MAVSYRRLKIGLALAAAGSVAWGSMYFDASQPATPAAADTAVAATSGTTSTAPAPVTTTGSTGSTIVTPGQANPPQRTSQPVAKRTRRS